jgi:hypothetical protein
MIPEYQSGLVPKPSESERLNHQNVSLPNLLCDDYLLIGLIATFDDIYVDDREDNIFPPDDRSDSDSEEDVDEWQRPVHYVYDAAAERTQQRIREGQLLVVDGVH